jgi:hypothetical protein
MTFDYKHDADETARLLNANLAPTIPQSFSLSAWSVTRDTDEYNVVAQLSATNKHGETASVGVQLTVGFGHPQRDVPAIRKESLEKLRKAKLQVEEVLGLL